MKILLIVALGLLSACSTMPRQPEAEALFQNHPQVEMEEAEIEIPLLVGQGGRRFMLLELGARKLVFLVDTGAVPTIVSAAVAQDAGIATIPVPHGTIYGGGGGSSASVGLIEGLRAKGVIISRLPVFFTDLTEWNARELAAGQMKIDGIMGSDLLEDLRASIDYQTNQLKIRRPDQQPASASGLEPSLGSP